MLALQADPYEVRTTMTLVSRSLALVSIPLLSLAAGCVHGNYRVVKTVPSAGEVALEGPQEEARQKAEGYMASRCPSGYDIVEEGEAVVGQNSTSQTREGRTALIIPTMQTTTSTTDKREWRIKYQCKGASPSTTTTTGAQGRIQEIVLFF